MTEEKKRTPESLIEERRVFLKMLQEELLGRRKKIKNRSKSSSRTKASIPREKSTEQIYKKVRKSGSKPGFRIIEDKSDKSKRDLT
jgi:hypothetical protein